jgi:hypothetical protein
MDRKMLKNANGHGAGLAGTGEKRERPVNENLEAMEVDFFFKFSLHPEMAALRHARVQEK